MQPSSWWAPSFRRVRSGTPWWWGWHRRRALRLGCGAGVLMRGARVLMRVQVCAGLRHAMLRCRREKNKRDGIALCVCVCFIVACNAC